MDWMDIFNDDAFSLISLTAAINNQDHVPGRAGALVFRGVSEGIATTTAVFESRDEALTLIPEKPRGAPANKETRDKANIRAVPIPHFPLEDYISADEVAGVREFGTTDQLRSVQSLVNRQLRKMNSRHDLTLEHLRLGALRGKVLGATGAEIVDLFRLFEVKNSDGAYGPEIFDLDLDDYSSEDGFEGSVRTWCHRIKRFIRRHAKMPLPSGWRLWAFCGDNFFDKLVEHPSVKDTYRNTAEQLRRLGANYADGVFEYGGIVWENYVGTDDNSTVAVGREVAHIFPVGVPGLYAEYFAPANFMETVNTRGLPRYAKIAPDQRYNQFVELHTQQNPLPICLRPKCLVKAVTNSSVSEGDDFNDPE